MIKYKSKRRIIIRAVFLLLFPVALALARIAAFYPQIVEKLYSRGVYCAVSGIIAPYFSLFPFSCAEIFLYTFIIFAFFLFALAVFNIVKRQGRALLRLFVTAGCVLSCGYFLFVVMWGLNYCRMPLENNLGYKTGNPTVPELCAVMKNETSAINSLCDEISYDQKGRSHYAGGFQKISAKVNDGYSALSDEGNTGRSLFSSGRPRPKGILCSKLMAYTGIEGIFIPFTYEPNVNTDSPDFVLPFDAAHESAHFKGFAREQEANFIAYLADCANPDAYFQYSAHMEAYIYVSNALYSTDYTAWRNIASKLDRRAVGDFNAYNDYISAHKSKAADISNKINDSYLKSQGQKGVITYDMFVSLLCDHYRTIK